MVHIILRFFKSFFRVLTKKRMLLILSLTSVTFLLGTFGFRYYENEGIDEDNENEIQDYLDLRGWNDTTENRQSATMNSNQTDHIEYHTSFYWTFTTVTTVGFGDYSPATDEGRVVYYIVALTGISVLGIIIGELGSRLVELSFMKMKGFKKSKLKNHIIIVGWNATTEVAHSELINRGDKCVVIDGTKDFMEMKAQGVDLVVGNALDTEVLKKAAIESAQALIVPIKSDEDTVMISLKARRLNKNIRIIASVKDEQNMDIVQDAGVNQMIPASTINGLLLANSIGENLVVDFIVDICQELEGLDISQHILKTRMKIKDIPMDKKNKVITAYRRGKPFLDFKPDTELDKGDWVLSLSYHENK